MQSPSTSFRRTSIPLSPNTPNTPTRMLGYNRSMASPAPPPSPSAIPRPSSVASNYTPRNRTISGGASSVRGSPDPESRNVKVVLRVRPADPDDASVPPRFRSTLVHPTGPENVRVDVDPATLAGHSSGVASGSKRHPTFTFDSVLGETSTQLDLYDATAKDKVDEFMKGHNVTFLAYGQTSSGKSYSMGTTGEDSDYTGTEFNNRTGLIPRTVRTIFEKAEEVRKSAGPGASWECRLSFLELYNEDIIDLLSGSGVAISIREERDGKIIWSGVREVKVKTLAEVMQLLYEGSARRKTGETTMNATSSRSHAIFSLTLVQKRRTTVSPFPSSLSQPLSSAELSTPTRGLKRPTSMIGISAARSPTPSGSRPPPSSFTKGGPGSATRPNSFMGPSPSESDMVVITSKFNMVDLAGSERLKRTAAQGDRMKEGISINSGLLALGNVISVLADPVKARGHIPYRDSKLTRMLQDSIGGNALTTMIACVSPVEYNINETINTIKYASRARNIKNAAKVNAVEVGWDDVEHLQTTVLKLRKQLATIDAEGGVRGVTAVGGRRDELGSEKLLHRLAELQREHTELYDRYLGKCSENMRLTSELKNAKPGDGDALAKFNETVEPVIIEYEKVVAALNKQLDELRTELSMLSEMHDEQDSQLTESREKLATSEGYVSELRVRLTKLTERNTSSEAYIQDLEAKLKSHAETEDSHSEAVADLKKDIAKLKESNDRLNHHTSEIEARLTTSETRSSTLVEQLEKQERDAGIREEAYRDLERQFAVLDSNKDKDTKLLLDEINNKDRQIFDLQKQMEAKQEDVGAEHAKLTDTLQAEKAIQAELRSRLQRLEASTTTPSSRDTSILSIDSVKDGISPRSSIMTVTELTPPDSPATPNDARTSRAHQNMTPAADDNEHRDHIAQLEEALKDLATRCADAESRYTDAEGEIQELRTQLNEAKLIHEEMDDVVPNSAVSRSASMDDISENGSSTMLQTPRTASPSVSPVRRHSDLKRESLPAMGVRDLKIGGKDFQKGRGSGDIKRRPQSLSQELSSAQSSAISPRTSWGGHNSLRLSTSGSRQSLPAVQKMALRSPQSLEAELKFVHSVVEKRDEELRDREMYIRQLEQKLQEAQPPSPETTTKRLIPSRQPSTISLHTIQATPPNPTNVPLPDSPSISTDNLEVNGDSDLPYTKPPAATQEDALTPISAKRYYSLKRTLSEADSLTEGEVISQAKVDGLLKEMAVKESSQRAIIDQQYVQIADLQKANNKLREELFEREPATALALDYVGKRDTMTSGLRSETPGGDIFTSAPTSPVDTPSLDISQLHEDHARELEVIINGHKQTIDQLSRDHSTAMDQLKTALADTRSESQARIEVQREGHGRALADLGLTHEKAMAGLQSDHEQVVASLKRGHETTIGHLRRTHEDALQGLQKEQESLMEEMEKSLSASEEQRRQTKMRADQAAFELSRIRDEAAIERQNALKQFNDLKKAHGQLEKINLDLEAANAELNKRVADLDQRFLRKSTTLPPMSMPPQGPPPNTPLPPLPGQTTPVLNGMSSPMAMSKTTSSEGTWSNGTHNTRLSTESTSTAPTSVSVGEVASAVAQLPEPVGHMVQKIMTERDAALAEKEQIRKDLETDLAKAKAAEAKLQAEVVKAESVTRDLHEARKTNSKLRAHLEDARQETKRLTDACQEHMDELNDRRNTMSSLSHETGRQRDSLVAANAQVVALRAQLDRAVEQKVNKKLNSRLKCF